jgi:hypothetical protein
VFKQIALKKVLRAVAGSRNGIAAGGNKFYLWGRVDESWFPDWENQRRERGGASDGSGLEIGGSAGYVDDIHISKDC